MSEHSDPEWEGEGVISYIDIDDFKQINDNHGHSFGDEVIEEVVEIGDDYVSDKGIFTREYGDQGDEFVVIFPNSDKDTARDVGEAFREAVADSEPNGIEVSVSVGIAEATAEVTEFNTVKNWAETAMRRAKDWGGNQIQVYGDFEPLRSMDVRFDIPAPPGRPDDRIIFEQWRDGAQVDILAEVVHNETTGATYESESSSVMTSDEYYQGELRAVVSNIQTVGRRGIEFTVNVRETDYEEIFED